MTEKEFITWFKGFVEACHEYAPTPKQWDTIKDQLKEVHNSTGNPVGTGRVGYVISGVPLSGTTTTNDKHLLND